jgi:hypothetical protein
LAFAELETLSSATSRLRKKNRKQKKKKNKKQKMSIVLLTLLGAVVAQTYHSEVMDMMGKYTLHWGITNTTLELKVVVNATGWVAFGLSPTGGMKGSDIVMGWINADGSKSFSDRFAAENDVPVLDPVQSYQLLELSEANGRTTMRFSRSLATCDDKDALLLGTARVIFAFSDVKPVGGVPSKHATMNRGTRSVNLLNRAPLGVAPTEPTVTVDFTFKNAVAPGSYGRTRYWWGAFKFPQTTKHHIVSYEPIVPLAEISQTHHMLIYLCHGAFDNNTLNYVGDSHGNAPKALARCNFQRPIAGWAVGGLTNWMPAEFGLPVGEDDDHRYVLFELHLDVIDSTKDTVTNAGIRFFLTDKLRESDGNIVTLGASVDSWLVTPPNTVTERRGYCVSECTNATIPVGDMQIYATMLHAHTAGVKLHVQHLDKNGTELAPIASDLHYDFNLQQWTWLETPRTFKRGDQAITTCTYDTTGRSKVTLGGQSTSDEMCLVYMLVYARRKTIDMSVCLSTGTTGAYQQLLLGNAFNRAPPTNSDIDGYLRGVTDWSNFERVYGTVMKSTTINTVQPICGLNSGQYSFGAERPAFKPTVAYVPPAEVCVRVTTTSSGETVTSTTTTGSDGSTASTVVGGSSTSAVVGSDSSTNVSGGSESSTSAGDSTGVASDTTGGSSDTTGAIDSSSTLISSATIALVATLTFSALH